MSDLYEVLGVPRDATPDQIKKAYRHLAKTHHPDTGGDAEAFRRISHAFEVLSDPARRAKYDATGDDTQTPDPEASRRAQVFAIVRTIISGLVTGSNEDPAYTDFRARILRDLAHRRQSMETDKVNVLHSITRVRRFLGRFRPDEGENLIEDIIRQDLAELEKRVKVIEDGLELHERVTQFFLGYRYEVDPMEMEGYTSTGPTRQQGIRRYLIGGGTEQL